MRKIIRNVRKHKDGGQSYDVICAGSPKYTSILTDEDRRQMAEVKRLCGE